MNSPSAAASPHGAPSQLDQLAGMPIGNQLPKFVRDGFASLLAICRTRVGLFAALALNAIWMPYLGFEHDASLYAVQASRKAFTGVFANDLFLKFGSQDDMSAFSSVMAPVVRMIGPESAFFLVFMAAQIAFFAAVWTLYRSIFGNRAIVGLAMIFVAIVPMRYGGFGTFAINESFLTARTFAHTLSILALAATVRGRMWQATALAIAAIFMHPIIAFPVLLTLAFCVAQKALPPRALMMFMTACVTLFLTSLLVPSVGKAMYGRMDHAWLDVIRAGMPYCFPELWPLADWERLLFVVMLCLAGALWAGEREFPMFAGLLLVGMVGMALSIAAPHIPYAMTLQAQAYRYAWPLYLLAVPLGMETVRRGWKSDSFWMKLAALSLFTYLFFAGDTVWRPIAWIVCLAIIASKMISGRLKRWPAGVLMATMLIPGALYSAVQTSKAVVAAAELDFFMRGANIWRRDLSVALGSAVCLMISWLLLVLIHRVCQSKVSFRWACVVLFVALQMTALALVKSPWCGAYGPERFADVEFVKRTVRTNPSAGTLVTGKLPTVHWPVRNPWEIWFGVEACSYFTVNQIGGELFDRATAMEVQRRARLAAPFDVPFLAEHMPIALRRDWIQSVYGVQDVQRSDDEAGALLQLCADSELDFAVLPVQIGDWATANNGRWFVYDCHQIRELLIAAMDDLGKEERLR